MIDLNLTWAGCELEKRVFQTGEFDNQQTPFRRIKQSLNVRTRVGDSPRRHRRS